MDENEHGHYVQFFDWKTCDGGETGIFSRLLDTGKRPLYDKEHNIEDLTNGTTKRLTQKKLDKLYTTAYTQPDAKLLIKARWFIKKGANFEYTLAQVHPPARLAYRSALAQAIKGASLDADRRSKIERMLIKRPKKFKTALKDFMADREADYLNDRAITVQKEVEKLKQVSNTMANFVEDTQKYCEAKLINRK